MAGGVVPEGGRPKVEGGGVAGAGAGAEPLVAAAVGLGEPPPLVAGGVAGLLPGAVEAGEAGAGAGVAVEEDVDEEELAAGAPPALGESTERMRAQVEVVAAELAIWLCCWAEMALCMPMPRVSVITALSIAMVWFGAPWTVK